MKINFKAKFEGVRPAATGGYIVSLSIPEVQHALVSRDDVQTHITASATSEVIGSPLLGAEYDIVAELATIESTPGKEYKRGIPNLRLFLVSIKPAGK